MKPAYLTTPDLSSAFHLSNLDSGISGGARAFSPAARAVALDLAATTTLAAPTAATSSVTQGRTDTVSTAGFAVADTLAFDIAAAPASSLTGAPYYINNMQPYLAINYLVMLQGSYPPRPSLHDAPEGGIKDEIYLGGMRMFAGNFAMYGTALAQGQILPIAQNTALFSIYGTNYGGNGTNTFALPNMQGNVVIGVGQGPGLSDYVVGEQLGNSILEIYQNNLPFSSGGYSNPVDNIQPTLATTYMIQVEGIFPYASGLTSNNMDMLGLVVQFGGNFAPIGYMPCDGRLLSVDQYSALYALLGTTYGGDGTTTFALPDLRGRTVVGAGGGPGLTSHALGEVIGTEGQTLTQNNMPGDMGGYNNAVNNVQPSLALNYIICLNGIYPSRNALTDADGQESYIGEIAITAINFAPKNWAYCAGQLLPIAQYQALFSILGTTYGGNGTTNFALPDLRGRTAIGSGNGVTLGQTGGTESYTLNTSLMPALTINGNDGANNLYGAHQNDAINGYGANDSLVGNGGNDTLDGGAGNDTMNGGYGNDVYYVDSSADSIIDGNNQGFDVVFASATFTLAFTFVDNLTLTGTGNINGTGNGQSNLITGTTGNNRLDGAANNDTMTGGLGDDTYVVSNVGDVINENAGEGTDTVESVITFTLTDVLENLTLTGTADINGTGNAGNNILTGNTGINNLAGKAGDDTYFVQNTGDNVIEATNEGTDLINSTVTYTLAGRQVENLTLTGSAAIDGTGNGLANILNGNSGANLLDGGANNDTMNGGAGNDTYIISAVGDVVTELPNQGTDTVQTPFTTTLGANLENLTLTGTADLNGDGNALNNVLTGNAGVNVLTGGAGHDTYYIQNVGDNVVETSGNGSDVIFSTVTYSLNLRYAETLNLIGSDNVNATGNSLGNTLGGNDGNNTINGKGGNDTMSGGLGSDLFFFEANSGTDTITDFSAAQNDTININAYTGGVANAGLVTQNGSNVVITLAGGNVITINNALQADVLSHIVW